MLGDKCHKCYAEPLFSLNIKVEGRGAHIKGGRGRPHACLTFLLQDINIPEIFQVFTIFLFDCESFSLSSLISFAHS